MNIFVVLQAIKTWTAVQIGQWHRYKVHAYVRTTRNCDANSFRFFLAKLRVTNRRPWLGLKYPEGVGTEVTNGQRLLLDWWLLLYSEATGCCHICGYGLTSYICGGRGRGKEETPLPKKTYLLTYLGPIYLQNTLLKPRFKNTYHFIL